MAVLDSADHPLTDGSPAEETGYRGPAEGLVEEDEAMRVDPGLDDLPLGPIEGAFDSVLYPSSNFPKPTRNTRAISLRLSTDTFRSPRSTEPMKVRSNLQRVASVAWVRPRAVRNSRTRSPSR